MVVRFDNGKLQQTVERKTEAIGVEGDPPSIRAGGISEADAIVGEARKSMGDVGHVLHSDVRSEEGVEEDKARISQEIIREEEEKEVGPEVDADGLKNAQARAS